MANIQQVSNVNYFNNGFQNFVGKNIFSLSARAYQAAAKAYSAFVDNTGTAYQVPDGKTLVIVMLSPTSDNTAHQVSIGYGDTSVNNSTTAPTNYVQYNVTFCCPSYTSVSYNYPTIFKVPTGKYPTLNKLPTSDVASLAYIYCYLE